MVLKLLERKGHMARQEHVPECKTTEAAFVVLWTVTLLNGLIKDVVFCGPNGGN